MTCMPLVELAVMASYATCSGTLKRCPQSAFDVAGYPKREERDPPMDADKLPPTVMVSSATHGHTSIVVNWLG